MRHRKACLESGVGKDHPDNLCNSIPCGCSSLKEQLGSSCHPNHDRGEEGETERGNPLIISCGCGWLQSVSTDKIPTLLQWGLQWSAVMARQCGGINPAPSLFPVKLRPPGNLQLVSRTENTYNLTWSLNISSHYLDGEREYQVRYRTTSQSWEVNTE